MLSFFARHFFIKRGEKMKYLLALFYIVLLLLSTFFFYVTFNFRDSIISDAVGPEIFPRIMLVVIAILSIIQLLKLFIGNILEITTENESLRFLPTLKDNIIKMLITIALVSILVFFTGKIPFVILYSLILLGILLLYRTRWPQAILVSVILTTFVYLAFTKGFNIYL